MRIKEPGRNKWSATFGTWIGNMPTGCNTGGTDQMPGWRPRIQDMHTGEQFLCLWQHGCCKTLLSAFKRHEQQRTGMLGEAQAFVNNFDLPWVFHQHLPVHTIPRFQFLTKHWDFGAWFDQIVVHVWLALQAPKNTRRQLCKGDEVERGAPFLCAPGSKPPSGFCRDGLSLQRP